MKRTIAVWAVLLAWPVAAADTFSASSIDLDWVSLQAVPAAIQYRSDGTLSMEAQAVHAETEASRMAQIGPAGGVDTDPPETTAKEYGVSSWQAEAPESGASIFIIPGESHVSAFEGYGTALVPASDCLSQPDYYESPRTPACPSVGGSVHVKATSKQWLITGNFTLVLWSWHGTVLEQASETRFWTGTRATASTSLGVGEYEHRQAYLEVTQGILWLRPGEGAALDLFAPRIDAEVEQATIHGGPSAGLPQAAQPAQGRMQVSRTAAGLEGTFQGGLFPQGHTARAARLDWPIGAIGAALLLAPVGFVLLRSNQALKHLGLANDNLDLENHRAAARHASKAVRVRRLRGRAGLLGAVACIRYGDLDGAERFIGRMHASPRHDEAGCRFLLAHVRVQQGRPDEGQDLLEECLRINPSYLEEAVGSSVLAPFIDPSTWPRGS